MSFVAHGLGYSSLWHNLGKSVHGWTVSYKAVFRSTTSVSDSCQLRKIMSFVEFKKKNEREIILPCKILVLNECCMTDIDFVCKQMLVI